MPDGTHLGAARAAALPRLRLGRRRQVDADRPAAGRDRQRAGGPAAALARDSRRFGTTGEDPDHALLLDGLAAGARAGHHHRRRLALLSTPRRAFIVADTPGHAQYTRNMATGAAAASLAVLLVDATPVDAARVDATWGLPEQTRRHAAICALFGIRDVVLAVNKMDLVGYDQAVFDRVAAACRAFAAPLGFRTVAAVPLSARRGDNMTRASAAMPWHAGPTLLGLLETADVAEDRTALPLRFPVQWVSRPDAGFRGYAGTIASGRIAVGEAVVAAASGRVTRVARIVTMDGDLPAAEAGQAVTLTLAGTRTSPVATCWRHPRHRRRWPAIRHPHPLDGGGAAAARPALCAAPGPSLDGGRRHLDPSPAGPGDAAGAAGAAGAERDRALPPRGHAAPAARPLCGEPRDRRLHPGGHADQPDSGRRHGGAPAAARHQHPSGGNSRWTRRHAPRWPGSGRW